MSHYETLLESALMSPFFLLWHLHFRRPKATCLTQKQGSTDILNADVSELDLRPSRPGSDGSTDVSHPHLNGLSHSPPSGIPDLGIPDLGSPPGTGNVILANGELSLLQLTQQHHSTNPPPNSASSAHNSNGSAFTYHFDPSMTSSATSNTNSVGSNFDPFETGHSRSNSSQTSSSRISTGFNSLPSHSRQGSADSENTGNARYVYLCLRVSVGNSLLRGVHSSLTAGIHQVTLNSTVLTGWAINVVAVPVTSEPSNW